MESIDLEHDKKYPKTREEIQVEDYHNLVLKVFNHLVRKFGPWVTRHKSDLVQTGYVGLLKAKEKYVPGRGSFLGLAYLRIMSAMQTDIAKYAKYEAHTYPAEDILKTESSDGEKLVWSELFPGIILDYDTVLSMVQDTDDKKVLYGVINQYPYWKLRAIINESKTEHEARIDRIKGELCDILEVLHPNQQ